MNRNEAVAIFGSVRKLAAFLKLGGTNAVYNWKPKGRIPAKHEIRIRDYLERQARK